MQRRDHANGASWSMSTVAGKVGQVAAATLDQRTVDDFCAQVSSAARAAVQQGVKPKPGSQEAQIVRLIKKKDGLRQRVDHLQGGVDVLQEAAAQAKAETVGLRMGVVRIPEENTWLRLERDNAVQVRERALANATRLWQLVDRLGGDCPMRGSQSWHGQPTGDTERDPLTNLQGSAKQLAA